MQMAAPHQPNVLEAPFHSSSTTTQTTATTPNYSSRQHLKHLYVLCLPSTSFKMTATEEQTEEIEVLQSIYPDELSLISETSFSIALVLDPPSNVRTADGSHNPEPPTISLTVSFPPAYPSVAPELDVSLEDPGTVHPTLDFPSDKELLLSELTEAIEDNLGMPMVFTLASTIKDAAETLLGKRADEAEAEREAKIRKEEEKENEKFHGELVTKERFLAWREGFVKEKREAEEKKAADLEAEAGAKGKAKEKKLTGKELWERGMVGDVGDEEEGDELVDGVGKLKVAA
ncbi:RWD-domain-containing protein [Ascodesmis nigricans]|uniref:RWD-domain-containing protein n=1 Tax=Ascodesmis nigricans TaxID=341454 RepID=A0A4S2N1P9_9PEZI|nr:RWD-domain-containing protein [Ascodesmis nigricans]